MTLCCVVDGGVQLTTIELVNGRTCNDVGSPGTVDSIQSSQHQQLNRVGVLEAVAVASRPTSDVLGLENQLLGVCV